MVDVVAKLAETQSAIAQLEAAGVSIPAEACELAEIMARCVAAERELATHKRGYRVEWACVLRASREARGLSVEELGCAVAMGPDRILQIESGVDPLLSEAVRLATWAQLNLWDLWQPTAAAAAREQLAARSA